MQICDWSSFFASLQAARNKVFFFTVRFTALFFFFLNILDGRNQGRNEVKQRQGEEASLVHPCSNLRSFRSKCTELKEVLATLLGLFGAPRSHSAPPEVIRRIRQWFGAPIMIWRPNSDSAPGEFCPQNCLPFPPRYARGRNKTMKITGKENLSKSVKSNRGTTFKANK